MHLTRSAAMGVTVALIAACGGDRAPPAQAPVVQSLTVSSEYLGPFAGEGATLHPDNVSPQPIAFYGTDLGFSYQHGNELHFLFGDSWATEKYAPIQASTAGRFDDSFGTVDLKDWADSSRITAASIPPLRLGQNAGTTEASAIDPGHVMDLGKTPMAGFSSGAQQFGIFNLTKPVACTQDADCSNGLTCDKTLGYFGNRASQEEGLTLGCREGSSPACVADTMLDAAGKTVAGSGLCTDESSPMRGERVSNLLGAIGFKVRIGMRDPGAPKKYTNPHDWLTNKFLNVTVRTVETFDPSKSGSANQDYRVAQGSGGARRLFLWGRPGFIGVAKNGRSLPLYFAYADMPTGPAPWKFSYYTGSANGLAQFSTQEKDAQPLDLDATRAGVQPEEVHDITNQMSVAWVEPLKKWVMFYGGGLSNLPTAALQRCGVLELFTGAECTAVNMGNGAVRMRMADDPWGPWTPPQDVIVGGIAAEGPQHQFGPGGALHHPDCAESTCAPHSDMFAYSPKEYGFFYSANIVEQWTRPTADGVDIVWNASTWDPYRVVLLRTHIVKPPQ